MKMLLLLALSVLALRSDFKTSQLKNERVQVAYREKLPELETLLKARQLHREELELYLQAYKQEQVLEIWARNKTGRQFQLLRSLPFCATSGRLGPKSKQGDKQIPEGFYMIDRFNPESLFYLSLGLNYPNAADRIRNRVANLGGNIFIHGKCASVGCITITDEGIKLLYVLAVEAQQNGQAAIPVHIFPTRLTASGLERLSASYLDQPDLVAFWQNLKTGYDQFQQQRMVPVVSVNAQGKYTFRSGN